MRYLLALPPAAIVVAAVILFAFPASADMEGGLKSGIATCYFDDARLASFSFKTGTWGRALDDGDVATAGTHMDAGWLSRGSFTVGCRGDDRGRILDLGDTKVLDEGAGIKKGLVEVRGRQYSIYHSLKLDETRFKYKVAPYTNRWKILLDETAGFFLPPKKEDSARIKEGHVYLVRIADSKGEDFVIAKFRVLKYDHHNSVTFHWTRLK